MTGRREGPHRAFLVTVVALAFKTLTVKATMAAGFQAEVLEQIHVLTRFFWGLC